MRKAAIGIPNFTKIAIKDAFLKLLAQKPLNKISVKDIVEECGINRNSFYYHFQDVPTLLEEIVTEETDKVIAEYSPKDTVESCLMAAIRFANENRSTILHVYHYMDRELLEDYVWRACEHLVISYTNSYYDGSSISNEDREMIVRFYKCELFGLVIDWANKGMDSSTINLEGVKRFCDLANGMITAFERRSKYGR